MTGYEDHPWIPAVPQPPSRRPAMTAGLALAVVGAIGALGFGLGWLWQLVAPDVPVRVVADDGGLSAVVPESQPEQFAAADSWFAILGVLFGVLVAVAAWLLIPRLRGPLGLLAVTLGSIVGAVAAWRFGESLGLHGFREALATASEGAELVRPSRLRITAADWWPENWTDWQAQGVLLIPALASAIAWTLMAGFSPWPSLRPEPEGWPDQFIEYR